MVTRFHEPRYTRLTLLSVPREPIGVDERELLPYSKKFAEIFLQRELDRRQKRNCFSQSPLEIRCIAARGCKIGAVSARAPRL